MLTWLLIHIEADCIVGKCTLHNIKSQLTTLCSIQYTPCRDRHQINASHWASGMSVSNMRHAKGALVRRWTVRSIIHAVTVHGVSCNDFVHLSKANFSPSILCSQCIGVSLDLHPTNIIFEFLVLTLHLHYILQLQSAKYKQNKNVAPLCALKQNGIIFDCEH